MDDKWDNDLSDRIREVFDNYEDTTADEGWLLLRERFPVKEKKRPVVWLWRASAAAGLLLFLGIGIWMMGKKQPANTIAVQPLKHQEQPHKVAPADTSAQLATNTPVTIKSNPTDTITSTPGSIANNSYAFNKKPAGHNTGVSAVTKTQNIIANINQSNTGQSKKAAVTAPITNPSSVITNSGIDDQLIATQPAKKQNSNSIPPVKGPDSVKTIAPATDAQYAVNTPANTAIITTPVAKSNNANQQPTRVKPSSASAMDKMLAADDSRAPKAKDMVDDKKVKFGIYAATFFNYAKGSANQVNAGAGFTSDIKLSKNLKLSTGVALAQNTLRYNTTTPPNNNAARAVTFAVTAQDNMLVPAAAFPVFKNYNANLVGLDVPINIKYEFNPQKSDAYISAGLSSGTFINEAYTTSYALPASSSSFANSAQQTTQETSHQSFNGFYFAKTLNVSFGIGTPLGKSNRLIIEPFLKYPLDGLGSQQIKFGAGGLNLKLNFSTSKK
jgi:hypothetical protein